MNPIVSPGLLLPIAACLGGLLLVLVVVLVLRKNAVQDTQAPMPAQPLPSPQGPETLGGNEAAQIIALMARGQKIEAIKIYRQATGVGLKEAKDAVEAMERGEKPVFASLQPAAAQMPAADLQSQVIQFLQKKQKIEAIRVYRLATGVGLKEAKDAVEEIERGL